MKSLKALSALLMYPTEQLKQAIPDIKFVLANGVFSADSVEKIQPLLDSLQYDDIYHLQETYVLLFDRSRTLSLNLFEHVHGESRDRGSAMVDLLETYRAGGFDLVGTELPDYLPVLLEYLSTQSLDTAKEILQDAGPILVALSERLSRRNTPYAFILKALVDLSKADANTKEAQMLLAEQDDDPNDLEALDAVWHEAQVTFGPDTNAGCPTSAMGLDQKREFPIHIQRSNTSTVH